MVKINSLIINNHKIIIMDKEINILIIISNFKIMIDRKIIIGIIRSFWYLGVKVYEINGVKFRNVR